jgi:hypothetical protein
MKKHDMRRSKFNSRNNSADFNLSTIDFYLLLFTFVVFICMMLYTMINPILKQNDGIKKNAEFVITMDWPADVNCDMDIYVRNPAMGIAYYSQKEASVVTLERDDRGNVNDTFLNPQTGKRELVAKNQEIVTLRGILPGHYVVNAHLFGCVFDGKTIRTPGKIVPEFGVKLKLEKINPNFQEITSTTLKFSTIWNEQTAFSFDVSEKGYPSGINNDYVDLVKSNSPDEGAGTNGGFGQ